MMFIFRVVNWKEVIFKKRMFVLRYNGFIIRERIVGEIEGNRGFKVWKGS